MGVPGSHGHPEDNYCCSASSWYEGTLPRSLRHLHHDPLHQSSPDSFCLCMAPSWPNRDVHWILLQSFPMPKRVWLPNPSGSRGLRKGASKVNLMDCEPTAWRKERNQTITSFNRELVVVWTGCGVDRVWIGLDRPRSGSTFLCLLQLGCSMARKGRSGVHAASGQLGCLAASVSAWQLDSLDAQQLQLGCWTAEQRSFKTSELGSLTAWLQQFVAWLLTG